MATRFHSKVARVQEMGGKFVVNLKEKLVEQEAPDKAAVDTDVVKLFDTFEEVENVITKFMGE